MSATMTSAVAQPVRPTRAEAALLALAHAMSRFAEERMRHRAVRAEAEPALRTARRASREMSDDVWRYLTPR
jgi:hypothetical protein